MKHRSLFWIILLVWMAVTVSLTTLIGLGLLASALRPRPRLISSAPAAVAVIPVHGTIIYGEEPSGTYWGGYAFSARVAADVKRANEDAGVGAIVLDIDSPGGSVVASVDIYQALTESDKPVVASMGEVAASGGYYAACAGRYILARPATVTGSIGVVRFWVNYAELARWLGVEEQVVRSGVNKARGGQYESLGEEQLAIHQAIIDELFGDFVLAVARGRDLPESRVRELADGRIYSGSQAVALGLVDELGDLEDAIEIAGQLAGISGEPTIVRYDKQSTDQGSSDQPRGHLPSDPYGELIERLLGPSTAPQFLFLYTGD